MVKYRIEFYSSLDADNLDVESQIESQILPLLVIFYVAKLKKVFHKGVNVCYIDSTNINDNILIIVGPKDIIKTAITLEGNVKMQIEDLSDIYLNEILDQINDKGLDSLDIVQKLFLHNPQEVTIEELTTEEIGTILRNLKL